MNAGFGSGSWECPWAWTTGGPKILTKFWVKQCQKFKSVHTFTSFDGKDQNDNSQRYQG